MVHETVLRKVRKKRNREQSRLQDERFLQGCLEPPHAES